MSNYLIIFLIFLSFNCLSQTQLEININAKNEYNEANKVLLDTYSKIEIEYKRNRKFIKYLKKSKKKWLKYRDSELNLRYPKEARGIYGSSYNLCRIKLKTKLTQERNQSLNRYLVKSEEGDICN